MRYFYSIIALELALIDPGLQQLATLIALVVLIVLQKREASKSLKAGEQRKEEVKQTVAIATEHTDAKLGQIQTLVDGAYSLALKSIAASKRQIANLTGKVEDKVAADEAERQSVEHEQKITRLQQEQAALAAAAQAAAIATGNAIAGSINHK